jgi:hypothetical protein
MMNLLQKFMDWYRYEAPAIPGADGDRVSAITSAAWQRHREQGAVPERFKGQSFHYYRIAFFGRVGGYVRKYFAEHGEYPSCTHYVDEQRKCPVDFGEPAH